MTCGCQTGRVGGLRLRGWVVVNLCVGVMLAAGAEVCDRLGCGERRVQCTERSKTYAWVVRGAVPAEICDGLEGAIRIVI